MKKSENCSEDIENKQMVKWLRSSLWSNSSGEKTSALKDWIIKLTPQGFTIQGFPINLQLFPNNTQQYLRWLIGFLLIGQRKASSEQSYFFKTLGNTIYKLWFSGVESLGQVITELNNGACNTTATDEIPSKLVVVANYDDHGGTVPVYAAVLARDEAAVPDLGVETCVSNLIELAHQAWQEKMNSGETIGITIGVISGLILCIGVTSAVIIYCKSRKPKAEKDENDSLIIKPSLKI